MHSLQQPKVAVLLATYNGANWLEEQLNSISEQKNVDITIFVSDDLSVDETLTICSDFKTQKFSSIILLDSHEKFGGAGKNFYRLLRDVDFSHYDYISLCDQDDIWNNDKISVAISNLKNKKCDCVSSNITAFYETGKICLIDKAQNQTVYDHYFEAAGPGCTYVMDIKMATHLQNFVRNNFEEVNDITLHDWLIYAFAKTHKYTWYIDDKSSMMYRQHTNNQVGANITIKSRLKRLKMIKDKWYRTQVNKISMLFPGDQFILNQLNKGYAGNIILAINFWKLRRKKVDKFFLLFILLLNVF